MVQKQDVSDWIQTAMKQDIDGFKAKNPNIDLQLELVPGFTTVTNSGGNLKLLNLNKRVKDLLQITKLYTVFDVKDDEAAAIKSFK